ncbi:MAG: hypothetical protein AB8I08_07775 [Sandaracinaceae bacterium]
MTYERPVGVTLFALFGLFALAGCGSGDDGGTCLAVRQCVVSCDDATSEEHVCTCPSGTVDVLSCGEPAGPIESLADGSTGPDGGVVRDASVDAHDGGPLLPGQDATCRLMCDAQYAASCPASGCQASCEARLEYAREIGCEAEWKGVVSCIARTPCLDDGTCGRTSGWTECLGL